MNHKLLHIFSSVYFFSVYQYACSSVSFQVFSHMYNCMQGTQVNARYLIQSPHIIFWDAVSWTWRSLTQLDWLSVCCRDQPISVSLLCSWILRTLSSNFLLCSNPLTYKTFPQFLFFILLITLFLINVWPFFFNLFNHLDFT